MTVQSFDAWVPEIWGGEVLSKVRALSAVEAYARGEVMTSDVKHVPRSGGMSFVGGIAKSGSYGEDAASNDVVTLTAVKFGRALRIAEEELRDTAQVASIITTKQLDYARSYAVGFDNACLAVTASSANGTTVPFLSVYADLTANLSGNKVQTATGQAVTYANVSNIFAKVEVGNFWADGEMLVIAHPAYRALLRNILDDNHRPVFVEAQSQATGTPDSLLGVPVAWSLGAKTSATATDAPTGNPLLFVGNRNYLIRGDWSGLEYMLAGADSGPAFLTDEALLKIRSRKGFVTGQLGAWACLEALA